MLRDRTKQILQEMHNLFEKGYTPKVKRTKSCNACSLKDICLPGLNSKIAASEYMDQHLHEEDHDEETA